MCKGTKIISDNVIAILDVGIALHTPSLLVYTVVCMLLSFAICIQILAASWFAFDADGVRLFFSNQNVQIDVICNIIVFNFIN